MFLRRFDNFGIMKREQVNYCTNSLVAYSLLSKVGASVVLFN